MCWPAYHTTISVCFNILSHRSSYTNFHQFRIIQLPPGAQYCGLYVQFEYAWIRACSSISEICWCQQRGASQSFCVVGNRSGQIGHVQGSTRLVCTIPGVPVVISPIYQLRYISSYPSSQTIDIDRCPISFQYFHSVKLYDFQWQDILLYMYYLQINLWSLTALYKCINLKITKNTSAECKSVRKPHANLPDTPVALTSLSYPFQLLTDPPGPLQSALRLCKRIPRCYWKHLQVWMCIQDTTRVDYKDSQIVEWLRPPHWSGGDLVPSLQPCSSQNSICTNHVAYHIHLCYSHKICYLILWQALFMSLYIYSSFGASFAALWRYQDWSSPAQLLEWLYPWLSSAWRVQKVGHTSRYDIKSWQAFRFARICKDNQVTSMTWFV